MADSSSGRVAEPRVTQGERKKRYRVVHFVIRLVKEKPLGTVGAVITLLLLLTGIFAGSLAPYGMNETNMAYRLSPPSSRFWLGTDNLGRDVLSRVIFGARVSMIVGLAASAIAAVLGTFIGVLSGYIGGKFDIIVQRFIDARMCLPTLVILMVIMAIVGAGMWTLIMVIGILTGLGGRITRSAVISIKEDVYVAAAVAIGCSTPRILFRHILPNIMPLIIVLFTASVPGVMLTEAALSFLGFGIPPPFPSWGGMLAGTGRAFMHQAPWMVVWPGLALAIVVYGINMFGDAIRDILDPRLRGGIGRYDKKVKKEATTKMEPQAA